MKKKFLIAAVIGIVGGAALHFLYDALPNPLTALVSPVNESAWEHLKLLFWPMLLTAFPLARGTDDRYAFWGGIFAAELLMPLFLLGGFYLLQCGFWVYSLPLDIALYVVTMALGYLAAYWIFKSKKLERLAVWLLIPVILYGASLILFTFAAPQLGVFLPPTE
ncbi:MAG: hypothetical protein IJG45_09005 [Oscillospiraceae bacterium]|nr:hypothetical protein [Oscillospiraceae bacterium]